MKHQILAGVLFFFTTSSLLGQTFEWAKSFGGSTLDDVGNSVTVDASGNVYTTGRFAGTVDFNPGTGVFSLTSLGEYDVFIQKLDPSGNFLWAKSFGGNWSDIGHSITVDASGNVFTTGQYENGMDIDPGSGTHFVTGSGLNAFVQKLDASGNFQWGTSYNGGGNDQIGYSISFDALGNVFITGTTKISGNLLDFFVQKLDPSGALLWAKCFGSICCTEAYSVATDVSGNVFTTGRFRVEGDFDP